MRLLYEKHHYQENVMLQLET
ncbi:hypothetical protein V3C99_010899, partial [Haemonchus contortus]